MPGRVVLETARLVLREFTAADAAACLALGNDPEVTRTTREIITTVAEAAAILRDRVLADYRAHGFGRWACVERATGTLVGFSGLKRLPNLDEVDIGYRFLRSHWGRGLATEAGRAVLAYGFERLALPRVIGLVDPANTASVRVSEKLGLRDGGTVEYQGEQVTRYVVERSA